MTRHFGGIHNAALSDVQSCAETFFGTIMNVCARNPPFFSMSPGRRNICRKKCFPMAKFSSWNASSIPSHNASPSPTILIYFLHCGRASCLRSCACGKWQKIWKILLCRSVFKEGERNKKAKANRWRSEK